MQRVWNFDENIPSNLSESSKRLNIPMHNFTGNSKGTSVILNDTDAVDNRVNRETDTQSCNSNKKSVDQDLQEETTNELIQVLIFWCTMKEQLIEKYNL